MSREYRLTCQTAPWKLKPSRLGYDVVHNSHLPGVELCSRVERCETGGWEVNGRFERGGSMSTLVSGFALVAIVLLVAALASGVVE